MQNKAIRTLSALALTAAFAAAPMATMAAQHGKQDHATQHKQRMGSWAGHKKSAYSGHGLRGLQLSQEQQDQIFKIRHDQAAAMYEQKKSVQAAGKELRELTAADSFDQGKAGQAAEKLGQARAQLALLRAQTQAQIRAVLTPEQRQQLDERKSRKAGNKARKAAES